MELNNDKSNPNKTITVDIPVSAKVSSESSCKVSNTSQSLTLEWAEPNPADDSDTLSRNFTLRFSVNKTTGHYGVSRINGVYELRSYNETDPKLNTTSVVKEYISFTTFGMNPWEFSVATNK